jgi:hypothetical protein
MVLDYYCFINPLIKFGKKNSQNKDVIKDKNIIVNGFDENFSLVSS